MQTTLWGLVCRSGRWNITTNSHIKCCLPIGGLVNSVIEISVTIPQLLLNLVNLCCCCWCWCMAVVIVTRGAVITGFLPSESVASPHINWYTRRTLVPSLWHTRSVSSPPFFCKKFTLLSYKNGLNEIPCYYQLLWSTVQTVLTFFTFGVFKWEMKGVIYEKFLKLLITVGNYPMLRYCFLCIKILPLYWTFLMANIRTEQYSYRVKTNFQ